MPVDMNEMLAAPASGYYLIDASDLDTALGWAGKMPNIEYGSVEVRPVWDLSAAPAAADGAQATA